MTFRRREFSKATKREAFERSGGICECHLIPHVFPQPCGRPLGEGNTFYEHIEPSRISGRNDLSNCACLTRTCWRIKTAVYDQRIIARVRRREDAARAIRNAPTIPGNRLDPRKRKINGLVVDRRTGEPWRGW
jgi:hypothetical protein